MFIAAATELSIISLKLIMSVFVCEDFYSVVFFFKSSIKEVIFPNILAKSQIKCMSVI